MNQTKIEKAAEITKRNLTGNSRRALWAQARRIKKALAELNDLYGRTTKIRFYPGALPGLGTYTPPTDSIRVGFATTGRRYSTITTLHEYGHALRGRSETKAQEWALAVFKKAFPRSYQRLTENGVLMVRRGS